MCTQRGKRLCDLVDVTCIRILFFYDAQQVIGVVRWHRHCCVWSPVAAGTSAAFSQVCECHHISGLVIAAAFIRYPDFNACDVYTRRHIGQTCSEFVVVLIEILRQEEMTVLVVLVGVDAEIGGLCPSFCVDGLGFGVLLRHERRGSEFPELELGLQTEQGG